MPVKDYNLESSRIKELLASEGIVWYRGQNYSKNPGEARNPIHFTYNPTRNRWTPATGKSYYFGLDIDTVLLEALPIFREGTNSNRGAGIKVSLSALKNVEVISYTLKADIRLVDLVTVGAYQRHPIEPADILSRDLTVPNEMASAIYDNTSLNVDGVYYEARIGSKKSIVIFDSAETKMKQHTILERKDLYAWLTPDLNRVVAQFNLNITDDITDVDDDCMC